MIEAMSVFTFWYRLFQASFEETAVKKLSTLPFWRENLVAMEAQCNTLKQHSLLSIRNRGVHCHFYINLVLNACKREKHLVCLVRFVFHIRISLRSKRFQSCCWVKVRAAEDLLTDKINTQWPAAQASTRLCAYLVISLRTLLKNWLSLYVLVHLF